MTRSIETGSEHLTAVVNDGVAVITMDRPERRNAMTDDMLKGLAIALADVETAEDVRCVVLTGAGGAFCAGGDVKGFAEGDGAGGGGSAMPCGPMNTSTFSAIKTMVTHAVRVVGLSSFNGSTGST